jgi:hypothetical protein
MSQKVREGLLVGMRKKTAAERLEIKHHPYDEFRGALEQMPDEGAPPTFCAIRAASFKASFEAAALRVAGIKKTEVQALMRVRPLQPPFADYKLDPEYLPLWGIPALRMDIVRSADMNRTPDVRSRPCFKRWATEFEVEFVTPNFKAQSIAALVNNAGLYAGVGDYRLQKGGTFGQFNIVEVDEVEFLNRSAGELRKDWNEVVDTMGYQAQKAAFDDPKPYDDEAKQLLTFYEDEIVRRNTSEVKQPVTKTRTRKKKATA